ncbi:MAG TPA: FecR family protein, partial [Candidatus Acidoferrum sp.]|nr:FecR family protein [Candidatus Acidoferrum sp.]
MSRTSLAQPAPLKFKDDVFFRDEISTRERSTVRLLLGGKGTLTIREQSQVTLDESVAPDGARRSTINLLLGKVGAAIAHGLMRPGDSVEIRTPNAVAAVRGTVLIAEYIPPAAATPWLAQGPAAGGISKFLVTSGQAIITPDGLPPVTLTTMQAVSITATASGLQTSSIQNLTPAQAREQARDLQVNRPDTGSAVSGKAVETQTQIAAAVANVVIQNTAGQAVVATSPITTTSPISTTSSSTTTTATSVTPPPTAPESSSSEAVTTSVPSTSVSSTGSSGGTSGGGTSGGGTSTGGTGGSGGGTGSSGGTGGGGTTGGGGGGTPNTLANNSLLTLSNVDVTLADGTSLATFNSGTASTNVLPVPSGAVISTPLLTVTGSPITHSGTMVTVDPSLLTGSTGETVAPLAVVNGTSLTNSGGPIFDVSNSFISAIWPVLQLQPGANATLAGVMNIAGSSSGASEVSVGPHDAISLQNGSTLTGTDALFQVMGNSVFLTTGGASLVGVDPGTVTLQAPILSATDNSVNFLLGSALHAVDSTVTSTQPLVLVQGTSTFVSAGPVVLMNGGSLTADAVLKAVGAPTIVLGVALLQGLPAILQQPTITNTNPSGGALLELTNANASFRTLLDTGSASLTYSLNQGQSIVRMTDSNLTLTGEGEPVVLVNSGLDTPNGVALIATATAPGGGTIKTQGALLQFPFIDSTVSLTDPNAQIQLTNMTVNAGGNDSVIEVPGSVNLNGQLLSAKDSTISTGGSLLLVSGQLSSNTTQSLIQLDPSSVTAGASIVQVNGGQLNLAGPLLNVANSTLSSGAGEAFVLVNNGGRLVWNNVTSFLDLLNFSGSTLNVGANFFDVRGSGSGVTLVSAPLVEGDSSTINVTNNFLQIRDGASLTGNTGAPFIGMSGTTFTGGDPATNRGGSLLHMFSLNGT